GRPWCRAVAWPRSRERVSRRCQGTASACRPGAGARGTPRRRGSPGRGARTRFPRERAISEQRERTWRHVPFLIRPARPVLVERSLAGEKAKRGKGQSPWAAAEPRPAGAIDGRGAELELEALARLPAEAAER